MAEVNAEYFVRLAIPRPLEGLFTYRVPNEWLDSIRVGSWVQVPFGRGRTHAFVVERPKTRDELTADSLPEGVTIKAIAEIGSPEPILTQDLLDLAKFASEYYQAPIGEVLGCAVSAALLKPIKRESKSRKNANHDETSGVPIDLSERIESLTLSAEQEAARKGISALLLENKFSVAVIEGVTGSGKTEVYSALARETLDRGKNVLILVPEISLTPQIQQRFEMRLGMPVVLWHSAIAGGAKRETAKALIEGKARAVIGARSAVFAPIQNLGLVVVDEEHDGSYKQEDRVRYHARDLAIVRAKQNGAVAVLGSATPSLETIEKVTAKKFHSFKLTHRVHERPQPKIEIVDLKTAEIVENTQTLIAKETIHALEETIAAGEQAIVFLNRRGWASYLLCTDCGEVSECPNCSISLTLHRPGGPKLNCHLCGHVEKVPDICPKCDSIELRAMGAGTESLEEELPALVSGMRALRLDRDQITSHTRLEETLSRFRDQEFNTLLGTQMLVKGHDFPNVTLVVVMLADGLFRWPDFRAQERAYQVLHQVCGRSGRGEKPGRVVVQAFQTDNPVIQILTGARELEAFRKEELECREALHYPPFGRLALIRFSASQNQEAKTRAEAIIRAIASQEDAAIEVLGPTEAMIAKAKGEYRWDLMIKTGSVNALHRAVQRARQIAMTNEWPVVVDVDPSGLG